MICRVSVELETILLCKYLEFRIVWQGSTIGIHWLCTYAYFYWGTHDFGHAYAHIYAQFFPMIFKNFQNFSGSYNFIMFKNLLLYIWTLINLFALETDRFCAVHICFKKTFLILVMIWIKHVCKSCSKYM